MALKSIEEEWQGFWTMISRGTSMSQLQHDEMRKAFFAGAFTILCANRQIGEPEITEEEGIAYLDSAWAEAEQFYKNLIRSYSETN